MPRSRGSCSRCSRSIGRHAFVSPDGRALECGSCFTGYRQRDKGEHDATA
jgi:hypothetical protein